MATEEEKNQDVTEEKGAEEETTETPSDSETEKQDGGKEEVDSQGVPLKNRLAESERKRKALEERMTKIEEAFTQQNSTVQYPYQPQQPTTLPQQSGQASTTKVPPETQEILDSWYTKKRGEEKIQEADRWMYDQDPERWQANSQEAMGIIRSNIALQNQFNVDPLGAAKQAKKILDTRRNLLKKPDGQSNAGAEVKPKVEEQTQEQAKEQTNNEQVNEQANEQTKEQERIEKIKKTTTTTGKTTPLQKREATSDSYNQAVKTGNKSDVAKYFYENIDEKKLKAFLDG